VTSYGRHIAESSATSFPPMPDPNLTPEYQTPGSAANY
jgi:hypothetical protein